MGGKSRGSGIDSMICAAIGNGKRIGLIQSRSVRDQLATACFAREPQVTNRCSLIQDKLKTGVAESEKYLGEVIMSTEKLVLAILAPSRWTSGTSVLSESSSVPASAPLDRRYSALMRLTID